MRYFLSLLFFISPLYATITDTSQELIIPQNETYVLTGSHSYTNQIKIDGILYTGGYDGSADSGRLNLISPSIIVSSTGKILADGRGYGSASGPGKGINGWRGTAEAMSRMGGGGRDISGGSYGVKYSEGFHTARWTIGQVMAKSTTKFTLQLKVKWALSPNMKLPFKVYLGDLDKEKFFYSEFESQEAHEI